MAKEKEDDLEFAKIDELYEIYCYETNDVAYNYFLSAFQIKPEKGGGVALIELLNKYIDKYSKKISNTYSSIKKEEEEKENIDIITYNLQSIADVVNYYLDDIDKLDNENSEYKYFHKSIRPNDLFKFNDLTIKDAYKKYSNRIDLSQTMFDKTIELIEFIKDKNAMGKVIGKNDWYNMPTEEILISLKDFYKDNQDKFDFCKHKVGLIEELLRTYSNHYFEKIKRNCDFSFDSFNKYRPSFVSKQAMTPEIDKLIFCKNLLELYKKDLFVDRNGFLDCRVGYVTPEHLIGEFRKVYNKNFNEKTFRENQANLIFDPDFQYEFSIEYYNPKNILNTKSVETDDGVVIGTLLENESKEICYLLHILIKDISNDTSSYEIQLNLLPQGNINKRVQLIRFDNYETMQAHKNLGGKRLDTTTHVHLYNHFDLLRGKKNGNFDISHNLENESTDFISALHGFLSVMDLDMELHNEIIKKIKDIKTRRIRNNNNKNTEVGI